MTLRLTSAIYQTLGMGEGEVAEFLEGLGALAFPTLPWKALRAAAQAPQARQTPVHSRANVI